MTSPQANHFTIVTTFDPKKGTVRAETRYLGKRRQFTIPRVVTDGKVTQGHGTAAARLAKRVLPELTPRQVKSTGYHKVGNTITWTVPK